MSNDMIYRVTQALRLKLKKALLDSGDTGDVFVGPLDDPAAPTAALILLLYRISPNSDLRNKTRRVTNPNPPPATLISNNSLPLDLHFLLSVGDRPGTGEEALLKTLGIAMQALNDVQIVSGPGVRNETVYVSLEPLSTDEMSRVWTLFPVKNYRTSVAYLATPVWIDPQQPEQSAAPIVTDELQAGQKQREAADG